ncbi:hypothetical protein [Chroococcidiopsis cubana]|uniref:hypothetical protein n=1 Tax=Chroococcidiopsis cubana TaxID=171392 RepID=UPI0013150D7B|nr:hypothetical protein [Chroococcidiopsis cubana]
MRGIVGILVLNADVFCFSVLQLCCRQKPQTASDKLDTIAVEKKVILEWRSRFAADGK